MSVAEVNIVKAREEVRMMYRESFRGIMTDAPRIEFELMIQEDKGLCEQLWETSHAPATTMRLLESNLATHNSHRKRPVRFVVFESGSELLREVG